MTTGAGTARPVPSATGDEAWQPPGTAHADARRRRIERWGRRFSGWTRFVVIDAVLVSALVLLEVQVPRFLQVILTPFALVAAFSVPWTATVFVAAAVLLRRWKGLPDEVIFGWWTARRWAAWFLIAALVVVLTAWFVPL